MSATFEVKPAPPAPAPRQAVSQGRKPPRTSRRTAASRSLRRHWQLYLLIVVPLAYFVIFKYIPIANAVIAFKDYSPVKGPWGSPWVGFKNFELFFQNPVFWTLLKNTFILAAYTVLASFPIPIILAIALNEIRNGRFKKTVQLVTYAPYFISTVVVVSMTILVLSPRLGFVNDAIGLFGVPQIDFLGKPDYFRHIYVWSDVWQTTGYSAVIYLAALSGIDPALHESARIDGASRLQRIWNVDLPGHHADRGDHPRPRRRQHHVDRVREGVPAAEPAEPVAVRDHRHLRLQDRPAERRLQHGHRDRACSTR